MIKRLELYNNLVLYSIGQVTAVAAAAADTPFQRMIYRIQNMGGSHQRRHQDFVCVQKPLLFILSLEEF
jgi:hypothetical protein